MDHSPVVADIVLVFEVAWSVLYESAFRLMVSFVIAGLVHELLPVHRMQDLLDRGSVRPLVRATATGSVLPMCSCGIIPLGISLYYSGARLGTALAFMVATPIINPASVVPEGLLNTLLGADTLLALLFMAVLTLLMYVCAVAHIPMIASLPGTVMAPGSAVTPIPQPLSPRAHAMRPSTAGARGAGHKNPSPSADGEGQG